MKFAYKFSNLLGTVYHKGNLLFTGDGSTLISPVGNRITLYHLKDNKSETLPIESRFNISTIALAPNGCLLIAVNDVGEALLCSLVSKTVVHKFRFRRPIEDVKFSPDGKYFAVTKENGLFLYDSPGSLTDYNPFHLKKVYTFTHDKTLCIDWSSDSSVMAVGGADMTTNIYAVKKFENLFVYTLGSHTDAVVGCFFEENSLDITTVSKNGQVCVWECSLEMDELVPANTASVKPKETNVLEVEDEVIVEEEAAKQVEEKKTSEKFYYKRINRHYIKKSFEKEGGYVALTSCAYHRKTHLLVTGFSNGSFLLHEMPDCNLIHSLSISSQPVSGIAFNAMGDWIALGCYGIGQLIVWEWQSESFVLKQQGHFNNMRCVCYSPDGMYLLTGGEDGKVKLWDASTGFCVITRDEHSSSISDVAFTQQGKVFLSASLDGTVRAFDMLRYRNFRTFTSPRPTQFSCLAVDPSGDIVCAGSTENFEIFVWAMKTGRLVEVLAGHEAPVSSISFCPSAAILVSTSWDKTVRIWDVFDNKGSREAITLISDGLCIVFRSDGQEFAVSSLDGQISFFNVHTTQQLRYIEGRNDLYAGRKEGQVITAKSLLKSQAFTTLCYTADGECILAAGKSKYICLYHIAEQLLLKKFEITCNLSFDSVTDFISRRKMTEFGNKALIEERIDDPVTTLKLPGTRTIDMSSRAHRPEIIVSSVQFSPTGRAWVATTTEGLLVYSLDSNLLFDPFDLEINITPQSIMKTLSENKYSLALMMAFRLNEEEFINQVIESTPVEKIPVLVSYLPHVYVEKLLSFLSSHVESTPHIEFYLIWIENIIMTHGLKLKERSGSIMDIICNLQKNLANVSSSIGKICDFNKYSIEFLLSMGKLKKIKIQDKNELDDVLMNVDKEMESSSSSDESSLES